MSDNCTDMGDIAPVRLHFSKPFPIETRCPTSGDELSVVEILNVEYGLEEEQEGTYELSLFFSGIKSFSFSDDDQECTILWSLSAKDGSASIIKGSTKTGNIEMGERFSDVCTTLKGIPAGDYLLEILYV